LKPAGSGPDLEESGSGRNRPETRDELHDAVEVGLSIARRRLAVISKISGNHLVHLKPQLNNDVWFGGMMPAAVELLREESERVSMTAV
jgi:hypothetical protein